MLKLEERGHEKTRCMEKMIWLGSGCCLVMSVMDFPVLHLCKYKGRYLK